MSEEPEWRKHLELMKDDPASHKVSAIANLFANLIPPIENRSAQNVAPAIARMLKRDFGNASGDLNFRYGVDFFFGKYQGRPQSVQQNAVGAIYQGQQGVEVWRIMKSVAFATPDQRFFIAHVRGDRKIDEGALASALSVPSKDLRSADLHLLGLEYGTVNPFVRSPTASIFHVFDGDLIGGAEYPNDDVVFASSGDPRFYVGFNIRRYLIAITLSEPRPNVFDISTDKSEPPRIVARRRVCVIGGDSGIDTFDFSKLILSAVRQRLNEKSAYYGDRSLGRVDAISDPALAGSIDTAMYGNSLRTRTAEIVKEIQESCERKSARPIVTFSSMAMHGVAGELLRQTDGIEYIGPREALLRILSGLAEAGVEVSHAVLLGLSSVYDVTLSAFAGVAAEHTLPVDDNVRRQIERFIHDCKMGRADAGILFEAIRRIVLRVVRGKIELLKSKNIAIILGASELEMFANTDHRAPDEFAVIKSNEPSIVAAEIANAADKIHLMFIRPIQAVADVIALKTLGLEP